MSTPFTPLTKQDIQRICQVSLRTIDYWLKRGIIPTPMTIPGSRKVYWHPDVFYGWLNQRLLGSATATHTPISAAKLGRPRNQHRLH